MKTLLTFAAALAALASVSTASANDRGPGHWEWQDRPVYGPNKSNLPSRVRVWVEDNPIVAECNCAMMDDTATKATCMDKPPRSKG